VSQKKTGPLSNLFKSRTIFKGSFTDDIPHVEILHILKGQIQDHDINICTRQI